ncbi:SGNH/GDSL hydrolase family protein [Alteribacter populi]|uniref:SGNH/GDSL hydrolase family protein n=1 Tax=Alteribacter populi TaxID=2011011 RepID=UPI000BBAB464|nr:SGNH/GDSL hydrolase family protein [Alteribacter populi]
MKKLIFASLIIFSIGVIIFGKLYYEQRLDAISIEAQESALTSEQDTEKDEESDESFEQLEEISEELDIASLTKPMPNELSEKVVTSYENSETLNLVAFGSGTLVDFHNEGLTPWPELFQEDMNQYFGDLFEVQTEDYGEMTSLDFVRDGHHEEVAELQADIYIIEPFIWNDNGKVMNEHTVAHLRMMIEAIERVDDDSYIIVQPSQPYFEANNYLTQIDDVRDFARSEGYDYIDHWLDWPDTNDEELLSYLEEHNLPNQEGHQIWGDSITKWFIGH